MELNVKERLVLRGILPDKGNAVTYKAVINLHELLAFNEEEIEQFEIQQLDGQIRWAGDKDVPREFSFTKTGREVIEKALTDLDKKGELSRDTLPLYEKFMEGPCA